MGTTGISGEMDKTGGDTRSRRVIVVGAGVSGCACAAALSRGGVSVTLLNPALDHVCEPSFGPGLSDVGQDGERLTRILELAPESIRDAWKEAMLCSADRAVSVLDRRLVSVRTKQALEKSEGIELRQGLAVGLEVNPEAMGSGWEKGEGDESTARAGERSWVVGDPRGVTWGAKVRTVFAEELEADAVVVAVGLGLGGSFAMGEVDMGAGQYGQPVAEGLEACLRALGGEMKNVSVDVGPCIGAARAGVAELGATGLGPSSEIEGSVTGWRLRTVGLERVGESGSREGCGGPPSPYGEADLWTKWALVADGGEEGAVAVALPDGVATGEVALEREGLGVTVQAGVSKRAEERAGGLSGRAGTISRPAYSVRGVVVENMEEDGRLRGPRGDLVPVWVTGRTGGARDYLESLEMGLRTGEAVARALGPEACDGR